MSFSTCSLCTLKILCNSLVLPLYPPYIFINRPRPPHPLFSCSFSMFIFSFQKYTSSLVPCTTSGLVRPKFPITFCPTTNFTIHSALLLSYHHRYNLKLLLCTVYLSVIQIKKTPIHFLSFFLLPLLILTTRGTRHQHRFWCSNDTSPGNIFSFQISFHLNVFPAFFPRLTFSLLQGKASKLLTYFYTVQWKGEIKDIKYKAAQEGNGIRLPTTQLMTAFES